MRQLLPFLYQEALFTVTHVLVTSGIDSYNLLGMGLGLKDIQKLQLVQNAVTQAVICVPQSPHIIALLCKLHWLPVCFQMQFKVFVMTNKVLYSMGPDLSDHVSWIMSIFPSKISRRGHGSCL